MRPHLRLFVKTQSACTAILRYFDQLFAQPSPSYITQFEPSLQEARGLLLIISDLMLRELRLPMGRVASSAAVWPFKLSEKLPIWEPEAVKYTVRCYLAACSF